ncbi:choice-of-anchor D domain-containing protein [Terriglobus sp. RCC_193]|uniref:choice-of-anchor D domain-containing protein n=1 Tax=Terriglobus sp. RCC_193 TaxID=3239218 RepID=UPI003524BCAC
MRARTAAEEPAAAARRARAFVQSHQMAQGDSPAAALVSAKAQQVGLVQAQATSLATPWIAVGPVQVQSLSYGLVTGRVTSLALDPNDASNNTLYVGTSGGGVWKSTNAASSPASFAPLTDTLSVFSPNAGTSAIPSLSIGAVSVQPGGTGVILAGTGDPNDALDSYYGEGVLRSTDNGQTWSLIQTAGSASFVGEGIAGFAWSTSSPQLVVAAVSASAEAANVRATNYPGVRGLYYSANGGQTWTLATIQDGSTIVQNRTTSFTSFRGNAATSVVWNPIRKKFYAAIRLHGYYESSDGVTWTRMTNQPGVGLTTANCPSRPGDYGLLSCPLFRGTLTVQPTSGDMFAVTVDSNNGSQGLWQDACAKSGTACASTTVAWATKIDTSAVESGGSIPQGDYNLTLAAIPAATSLSTSDTLLFLGTSDLYRCSLSGGCSLRNTTNATTGCAAPAGVAPAQHAVAWGVNAANSATPTMFFGNDGGLWRSLDGVRQQAGVCSADDATHFDNLNGSLGSLAEVSGMASDPADASVLLVALGANGSAASTTLAQASSIAPWTQLNAAESGVVAIDQGSGRNWLLQAGAGVALHACTNGKLCTATDFSGPATIGSSQVSGDTSLTDPPVLLDPGLNTNALVGTCRVWRGPEDGGGLWSTSNAISSPMGSTVHSPCNSSDTTIRSLAAGGQAKFSSASQNSGSSVLYAGLSGTLDGGSISAGHIYSTTSASTAGSSTAWTDLTTNAVTNDTSRRFNAGGVDVSGIAVDPSDPTGLTVYATIQGFGYPHVYRSTNGGATWLNISANLPNAPANAVTVDPNNPAVVYVAMDTGVYVAQDVTTCVATVTGTTGACWSVYGTSLPNAPVTSLFASPGISIPGSSITGVLRAGTYGRGIWQVPLLTAGQIGAPAATFSPGSLTFGTQAVSTASASQTVTLKNTGTAAMQITGVSPSAGFVETDTCSGTSLPVNSTCTLTVSFAPVAAGNITGTVQVTANLPGGYASVALAGTATGVAKVLVSPTSISFGDVAVNAVSTSQTITVSNASTAAATLNTPVLTADYRVTASTCSTTLDAGSTCTFAVAYAPTADGANNGSLTLTNNAGTNTIFLSGNGVGTANVVYSPTSLVYHSAAIGSATVALFTISNTGTASSTLSGPVFVGDFRAHSNTCDTVLFAGRSCTIIAYFVPSGTGVRTGSMTFVDNAGSHSIALSGLGLISPSLVMPLQVTFPTTNVNSTSPSQIITVTNSSGYGMNLGITQVYGDFGVTANTCTAAINGILGAGASCQLTVVFSPTVDGQRNGFITMSDTASSGAVATTLLSGTGRGTAQVAVSPSTLAFGNVGIGSVSPAQTVQIANSGTAALALNGRSISGDSSFHIAADTCGSSLAVGATCALSITFAPTVSGSRAGTLAWTDGLGTRTVTLSGNGQGQAAVSLSPGAVDFGTVLLGQSASQTITVSNTGDASIGLASPAATGDFRVTATTCGNSIAAGATCTVTVAFVPAANGARAGTMSLADNASTHTVALTGSGKGSASLTFTPSLLSFSNTTVSNTSAAQTVTFTNNGTAAATLAAATVNGDFRMASNTCGSSLAIGASCSIAVVFAPTASGTRSGILSLADADALHSVSLQGTGVAGTLAVSPASIAFYDTALNTTTAVRNVVLTNSGNSSLRLGSITVTDDFAVSSNCNGVSLAGGGTCTLSVTFTPKSAGTHVGSISIPSDSNGTSGSVATVALTGNGKSAFNITLMPTSVDFGTQLVGSTSATANVTVSNTGTSGGALGSISVSGGDYSVQANTCGTSLASQVGCTVSLVFKPTASGSRTGTLTIVSDAGTQIVPLAGVGTAQATDTLSTLALSFGQQVVNTNSASQTITVTNNGDVPLTLLSAQILAGDFSAVNACGPTLPAHVSCAVSVAFAPKHLGALTGVLQIIDVQRAQTVVLNGTAIAGAGVSLSPSSLTFANTGVGTVGTAQTVTLTNNGGVPLLISAVAVTGNFGIVSGSSTCTTSAAIPVGGSCSMAIAFLPDGAGARTGSVVITSNAATQTTQLSGMGIDFSFAATGPSSVTISNGQSAAYALLLRPSVNTSDAVAFACSGVPASTKCTITPQYRDLSATGTVTVTLLTGTTANAISGTTLFLSLVPLPLWFLRRRVTRGMALAFMAITVLAGVQGCGSGRKMVDDGSSGGSGTTPSGSYTITVSATAAGVTHTVPLTLKVQ